MVFKSLRAKLLKTRAKLKGMSVTQYKKHMKEQKAERKRFNEELRKKKREEELKHKKWQIEQKYKQKRKQVKKGKRTGALGVLEILGGSTSQSGSDDPLGLFSSPTRKKKSKKRRKKR